MKLFFRYLIFTLLILLCSCYDDEGAYVYIGYTIDDYSGEFIDSVECKMYITHKSDESLYAEVLSDSTGRFFLDWSGLINKNDARITFEKKGYETVEFKASFGNNEYFNDTVFMKKE